MPLTRLLRSALPNPVAGQYFFPNSESSSGTSVTLGNGNLRVTPWLLETTVKIDRLGGEVSVVGDAGSKIRIGVYADTGNAYPGSLLLDAGVIAGDSATLQDITGLSLTLAPGLYWLGGAVQLVTTTQPTVRTLSGYAPPVSFGFGTSAPGANSTAFGYTHTGVTGALPATFTSTIAVSGSGFRIHARAA